eukprot:3496620-Rhodomonas_salina.1
MRGPQNRVRKQRVRTFEGTSVKGVGEAAEAAAGPHGPDTRRKNAATMSPATVNASNQTQSSKAMRQCGG